jgi:hypothetical protein
MANKKQSCTNVVGEQTQEALPIWVAPLESVSTFSIAEFAQTHSSPGDDGSGIFTQS